MWFRKIHIRSFAGIKEANIELTPGLNILHGPNELGKSTLVDSIRAALLLPHTSAKHKSFIDWHDTRPPTVDLTFETEEQRIWRVRKSFGTGSRGSSLLELSRDGVSFSREETGRAVDGKVRELLSWGAGSLGGRRGRVAGWPDTFLSTALIGSQDEVTAILNKGLEDDLDESGKDLLSRALQAIAESPVFRRVLSAAQTKVDQAFTATGRRKRAKDSPWVESQARIQRRREHFEQIQRLGEDSNAAKLEMAELKTLLQQAEDRHQAAGAELQQLETAQSRQEARKAAERTLAEATTDHERILSLVKAVDAIQAEIDQTKNNLSSAEETKRAAESELLAAQAAHQQAQQRILDLESDDAEQKRRIRRQEIEKTLLELAGKRKDAQREAELARDALDKERATVELENDVSTLEKQLSEARSLVGTARERIEQERQTLRNMTLSKKLRDYQSSIRALKSAEAARDTAAELRKRAVELKDLARTLRQDVATLDLPSDEVLRELAELEETLKLAEARTQIDLSLLVRPLREIEVRIETDEGPAETRTLSQPRTFAAQGFLRAQIDDAAEIEVSGNVDHRQAAVAAKRRWEDASVPLFEKLGVPNRTALEEFCRRESEKLTQAAKLEGEAAELEARAEGIGDAEARLEELALEADRSRRSLESELPDGTSLDDLRSRFEEVSHEEPDRHAQERQIAILEEQSRGLETRIAVDSGQLETQKADLEAKKRESVAARAKLAGDPQQVHDQALALLEQYEQAHQASSGELQKLDGFSATEVAEAHAAQESAFRAVDAATTRVKEAEMSRDKVQQHVARMEGELRARRAAVEAEDIEASLALVEARKKDLADLPELTSTVSETQIEEARANLELENGKLESLRRDYSKKEGALEQVGGQYIKEQMEDAEKALAAAQKEEHAVELEYGAWHLLLEKLKEAEAEDAVHLGDSLVAPISENMNQLTGGRYVSVSLGPELSGTSVSVEGSDRKLDVLSIGTREQLSTLIRLAVAQAVKSALVLDDQLVQSDPRRLEWLTELMYDCAGEFQIVVFTCRPDEYELADQPSKANWVNLEQVIERTQPLPLTMGDE